VGGASGSLKKIDISGGPAQTICDLPTGLVTGAWNRDGVILFGNTTGPLLRVSAHDEAPQPVTKLNTSRRELGHLWPHFFTGWPGMVTNSSISQWMAKWERSM